jgi:hypothetical protein
MSQERSGESAQNQAQATGIGAGVGRTQDARCNECGAEFRAYEAYNHVVAEHLDKGISVLVMTPVSRFHVTLDAGGKVTCTTQSQQP